MVVIYKCNFVIIDLFRCTLWNLFHLNDSLVVNNSQWSYTLFWVLAYLLCFIKCYRDADAL